jgi:hypothetical protein
MYLTPIRHHGRSWEVDLRVVPQRDAPGALQFAFAATGAGDRGVRYFWYVPPSLVDTLHLEGELSEEELRQQLERAIAEERTNDAVGSV